MTRATKENMPRRQTLFWDVDPATVDPDKHAVYIIERIMDFGNDNEVRWMWNFYPHDRIQEVVTTSRVLHDQTRIFWNALLAT